MTQLTLPGFEAPAPARRLFFAALPDPATASRIAAIGARLRAELQVRANPLHASRVHVTLHHLGDFAALPEPIVARACAAATRIVVPPFDVTFDWISSFGGRHGNHPLVLLGSAGLRELIDLQRELGDGLRGAGLRVSRARFTPHVTLLYGDGRFGPRAVEPVVWTVREFVLIDSWLGKTRHDVKGRWPLRGAGR